jgi:hypothetical protein
MLYFREKDVEVKIFFFILILYNSYNKICLKYNYETLLQRY